MKKQRKIYREAKTRHWAVVMDDAIIATSAGQLLIFDSKRVAQSRVTPGSTESVEEVKRFVL